MSIEIWAAFVLMALVVLIIPGPTIVLVISQAIAQGRRAVFPLVMCVTLGDFTAMTLSLLGLGAIMTSSAAFFSGLKWIGAAYLMYLGIKLWRSNPERLDIRLSAKPTSKLSLESFGFVRTEPYYDNPLPGAVYLKLDLSGQSGKGKSVPPTTHTT